MTHTTDQERAEPIKMQPGDDLHLTMLMAPHGLNFVTGKDREHLLAWGRDVWQASRRAQVVPDGWKLVPEEPTPAMYDRVMREGYYHDDPKAVKAVLRAEYQDMLAAAPQPQEVAQLDDTNVADIAQAVDSKEAASVQIPSPADCNTMDCQAGS